MEAFSRSVMVSTPLQLYGWILLMFHSSEVLLEWKHNREDFDWMGSLLITRPYVFAHIAGIVEFEIESYFFPSTKSHTVIMWIGVLLVVVGESIRKAGILTCKHNFTHRIRTTNVEGRNSLITHGIYRWVRHPGYLGWFIWAPATQLVLMNPICTVAFAITAQRFFQERVPYEEQFLRRFFPREYEEYARRTPCWIPGIR